MEKKEKGDILDRLNRSVIQRMKRDKRFELAVYGALVFVGILLYGASTLFQNAEADEEKAVGASEYPVSASKAVETEERLRMVLSCIRGAGRVEVMVTYETGTEIVPAMKTDTETDYTENFGADSESVKQSSTISSQPVTFSTEKGNKALVLAEKEPAIRGVIVIAEGAGDIAVRIDLQNAVKTVLGVDVSRIEVFEMKTMEGEA
ncbi:MAG: hypothetical protein E7330_07935 [Clostridiales bacterium]|nr:hypothetical protein [Clostridiales bacterium]